MDEGTIEQDSKHFGGFARTIIDGSIDEFWHVSSAFGVAEKLVGFGSAVRERVDSAYSIESRRLAASLRQVGGLGLVVVGHPLRLEVHLLVAQRALSVGGATLRNGVGSGPNPDLVVIVSHSTFDA